MFIGRKKELASLEELYKKQGFAMTVIYGRRRIGKSTLIKEFIRDKRAVFYTASKVGNERNVQLFSEQLVSVMNPAASGAEFPSLEKALDFITNNLSDKKLIIAIDELPYWAEKNEGLLSVLQKYVDTEWQDKNLMLILCGSSLSFMAKKVLSEKSPIFGRRDSQIKLEAFDYKEAALFCPKWTYEEKAICYGITGGVAKYLAMIDTNSSIDENIKRLFFSTDGYLFDEPRNLLIQEFSDTVLINNVIEQVASGENTLNIISAKVRESESAVLYSLERLIEVGIVERRKCILEENNRKKTQYVIKDTMFKFWYAFVPGAQSIIELGKGDIYYDKFVKPKIHSFMGSVFEDMCRRYTLENGAIGTYECFINRVGNWWGMESIIKDSGKYSQAADVDVVGISDAEKKAVIGECKFRNEKIDKEVYETLLRRAHALPSGYRIVKYLLFSLAGYTEWYESLNDSALIKLTLKDLYE